MVETGERLAYLQLAFTPELGISSFLRLLKEWGSAQAVIARPFKEVSPLITHPKKVLPFWQNIEIKKKYLDPVLAWEKSHPDNHLITLLDDFYPPLLGEVYSPPPVLFARGQLELLIHPLKIAMVGSRKATPQGLHIAEETGKQLSDHGFTVVSGLATGIDSASHRGALKGKGSTIAILGTGIDLVYPKSHQRLAHEIADKGLLLSEFPLGTEPLAQNFPRRNRIISGLCLATVVVEAALRSGSLITAHEAAKAGREVMAFPGSIHNPEAKGCHALIKEGARLIESADEIMEDWLQTPYNEKKSAEKKTVDSCCAKPQREKEQLCAKILAAIGTDPIYPDELANLLQLSSDEILSALLLLELEGTVEPSAGGHFQRVSF